MALAGRVEIYPWNGCSASLVYMLMSFIRATPRYVRVKSGELDSRLNTDSDPFPFIFWLLESKSINLANIENPDVTAHKELSHLDFHCLQMYVRIYLMSLVT